MRPSQPPQRPYLSPTARTAEAAAEMAENGNATLITQSIHISSTFPTSNPR